MNIDSLMVLKTLLIILLVLVLVTMVSIIIWFILSRKKENNKNMISDKVIVPVEEKTINLAQIAEEINARTEILEETLPPAVMVKLVNSEGDAEYESELSSQIVIGKCGESNDINIKGDKAIAGKQCRMYIDRKGYKLEDLGSANGTYLNDDYIIGAVNIKDNDILMIGRSVYTVKMEVI